MDRHGAGKRVRLFGDGRQGPDPKERSEVLRLDCLHTNRRFFHHQDEIQNRYNQPVGVASEITRSAQPDGSHTYCEISFAY